MGKLRRNLSRGIWFISPSDDDNDKNNYCGLWATKSQQVNYTFSGAFQKQNRLMEKKTRSTATRFWSTREYLVISDRGFSLLTDTYAPQFSFISVDTCPGWHDELRIVSRGRPAVNVHDGDRRRQWNARHYHHEHEVHTWPTNGQPKLLCVRPSTWTNCVEKQEAFEKCWAHSLLRAAVTLPVTRCR